MGRDDGQPKDADQPMGRQSTGQQSTGQQSTDEQSTGEQPTDKRKAVVERPDVAERTTIDRPEDPRRELGRRGEDLAAAYLTELGLVVLQRNWRCREGELDIISTDGLGKVYFCEVKTRSGEGYGLPAESVTRGKRRRIRRLATVWLSAHLTGWRPTQFDVISVLWPRGGEPTLSYLPGSF